MSTDTQHAPVRSRHLQLQQGCGCSPRGCAFTLLFLYLLQCLAAAGAQWHKYDTRTIDGVQLTLYYPATESVGMYIPGIGAMWTALHWLSWGKDYELLKAIDIQLPDGRKYTLDSENFQSLDQLNIRRTPKGIELLDDGQALVDNPRFIDYEYFRH